MVGVPDRDDLPVRLNDEHLDVVVLARHVRRDESAGPEGRVEAPVRVVARNREVLARGSDAIAAAHGLRVARHHDEMSIRALMSTRWA